uniref:Uncharacterized protein n=1 Tax=Anguilla anguilla TaxID=7936 RepID=A0A0E9XWN8_ANGAN
MEYTAIYCKCLKKILYCIKNM